MLNLTLKNIPLELHARLKAQIEAPRVDVAAELQALDAFVASLPRVDHRQVAQYRNAGRE